MKKIVTTVIVCAALAVMGQSMFNHLHQFSTPAQLQQAIADLGFDTNLTSTVTSVVIFDNHDGTFRVTVNTQ